MVEGQYGYVFFRKLLRITNFGYRISIDAGFKGEIICTHATKALLLPMLHDVIPKNDLLFVGYQAKGTPGRRMVERKIPVKAAIHTLSGYSAHADQAAMLINWVKSMLEPPKKITLVHGDVHARKALANALKSHFMVK